MGRLDTGARGCEPIPQLETMFTCAHDGSYNPITLSESLAREKAQN